MLEPNTIVMLIGHAITLILFAVAGTWKLSRVELSLREHIDQSKQANDERLDREAKHFGEALAGLRAGVEIDLKQIRHDISEEQKFSRDTFMRRESFYKVQEALQADIRALGTELKGRLERMEIKIDSKT